MNIIAILLGYFAFSFSLSALSMLAFYILSFINGILAIKIIGFIILLTTFEIVYEISINIVVAGVGVMARKHYPIIIIGILMVLEILFKQYLFYNENGLAWWFVIPGITAIIHAGLVVLCAKEVSVSETSEIETKAIDEDWNTAEYLSKTRAARKREQTNAIVGVILLLGVIIVSIIISNFIS